MPNFNIWLPEKELKFLDDTRGKIKRSRVLTVLVTNIMNAGGTEYLTSLLKSYGLDPLRGKISLDQAESNQEPLETVVVSS